MTKPLYLLPWPKAQRWRQMRSAPRDGTNILLAYPSFSDNGETYVGMARWVDVPHEETLNRLLEAGQRDEVPEPPYEPHWETSYVAVNQHCLGMWTRHAYVSRSVTIREPLGWLPLPEPTAAMKRRART